MPRSGASGVCFCGVLVSLGAVIGDVKSAALEDQSGAAADEPLHLALAALGAFPDRCSGDRLKLLQTNAARLALILVGGHRPQSFPLDTTTNARPQGTAVEDISF